VLKFSGFVKSQFEVKHERASVLYNTVHQFCGLQDVFMSSLSCGRKDYRRFTLFTRVCHKRSVLDEDDRNHPSHSRGAFVHWLASQPWAGWDIFGIPHKVRNRKRARVYLMCLHKPGCSILSTHVVSVLCGKTSTGELVYFACLLYFMIYSKFIFSIL